MEIRSGNIIMPCESLLPFFAMAIPNVLGYIFSFHRLSLSLSLSSAPSIDQGSIIRGPRRRDAAISVYASIQHK